MLFTSATENSSEGSRVPSACRYVSSLPLQIRVILFRICPSRGPMSRLQEADHCPTSSQPLAHSILSLGRATLSCHIGLSQPCTGWSFCAHDGRSWTHCVHLALGRQAKEVIPAPQGDKESLFPQAAADSLFQREGLGGTQAGLCLSELAGTVWPGKS